MEHHIQIKSDMIYEHTLLRQGQVCMRPQYMCCGLGAQASKKAQTPLRTGTRVERRHTT